MTIDEAMRTCLIFFLCATASDTLFAQQSWKRIAPRASDAFYVAESSVHRRADIVSAEVRWELWSHDFETQVVHVDCRSSRLRITERTMFTRDLRTGSVSRRYEASPDIPWRSYPTGSDGRFLADALCRLNTAQES